MLFDLAIWTYVVQVSIVQVIDMIAVTDAGVFAVGPMNMEVLGVDFGHFCYSC